MNIAGIILAAGMSSRMGSIKALLPFGDRSLLELVLGNARASRLSSLIVVLGHGEEEIRDKVNLAGTTVVVNDRYRLGQSTSLHAGLDAVGPASEAVMFLLGDQPFVGAKTIDSLLTAFAAHRPQLMIPTCHGKRGNPVVAHRLLFPSIREITGDTGLRVLFPELRGRIVEHEVTDPAIHRDVDTPGDYVQLVSLFSKNAGVV